MLDKTAWAEIRHLYVDTNVPIVRIAEQFGVSGPRISKAAKDSGWPMRSARLGRAPRNGVSSIERMRNALVRRLYRALDTTLEKLEARMASAETLSPPDEERHTRTLSAVIGGFEKVTEVHTDAEKKRKPRAARPAAAGSDAEGLRRDIAERLTRIHQRRNAAGGSQ